MMDTLSPAALASGKGHRDENFPVASRLIRPDLRAPIMAFYRFARMADDIADSAADNDTRLALLAAMRAGLDGPGPAELRTLAAEMAARAIDPVHAHDLLDAFVRDVNQSRYADWDDLIGYCRLSAMPVGRFVLDVHGEARDLWPANDALCAALQIVNHLQDCGRDFRNLDRVYIPLDTGLVVEDLRAERSSAALREIVITLTRRTRALLDTAAGFAPAIRDRRLAAEVAVIHRLACDLCDRLEARDPLAERVHHTKWEAGWLALRAALPVLVR